MLVIKGWDESQRMQIFGMIKKIWDDHPTPLGSSRMIILSSYRLRNHGMTGKKKRKRGCRPPANNPVRAILIIILVGVMATSFATIRMTLG